MNFSSHSSLYSTSENTHDLRSPVSSYQQDYGRVGTGRSANCNLPKSLPLRFSYSSSDRLSTSVYNQRALNSMSASSTSGFRPNPMSSSVVGSSVFSSTALNSGRKLDMSRSLHEGSLNSSFTSQHDYSSRPSTSGYSHTSSSISRSSYLPSLSTNSSSLQRFKFSSTKPPSIHPNEKSHERIQNDLGGKASSFQTSRPDLKNNANISLNSYSTSFATAKHHDESAAALHRKRTDALISSFRRDSSGLRNNLIKTGFSTTVKVKLPKAVGSASVAKPLLSESAFRFSGGNSESSANDSNTSPVSQHEMLPANRRDSSSSSSKSSVSINKQDSLQSVSSESSLASLATGSYSDSSLDNQYERASLASNSPTQTSSAGPLSLPIEPKVCVDTSAPTYIESLEPSSTQLQELIELIDFNQETSKSPLLIKRKEEEDRRANESVVGATKLVPRSTKIATASFQHVELFILPTSNANRNDSNSVAVDDVRSPSEDVALSSTNPINNTDVEKLTFKLDSLSPVKKSDSADGRTTATFILPSSNSYNKPQSLTQNDVQLPTLVITHPSAPSTPMSATAPEIVWPEKDIGGKPADKADDTNSDDHLSETSFEDEEAYEDEEASEWEETEDDEEDEYDTQLTIPLFTSSDTLHPNHTLEQSDNHSTSSSFIGTDFDTDFDLVLMVKPIDHSKDQRGRTLLTNVLPPPPIFTASVTYDGMDAWEDSPKEELEETDDEDKDNGGKTLYVNSDSANQLESSLVVYPTFYSNESEYDGNVEVGCTLSLVDRAALQDEEYSTMDSEYESEYYEDEESYSEEELSAKEAVDSTAIILDLLKVTEHVKPEAPVVSLDQAQPEFVKKIPEDKSAVRKAPENMCLEDQQRIEQQQRELANQKARQTGVVSSIRSRYCQPSPPKQEPITYKRSSRLDPKPIDELRPKRTYDIVKPVINDDFDKQMAELREQMKDKSSQLQNEYNDLSRGIYSTTDGAKLRATEEQHRELLSKAADVFRADDERKRWQEQRVTDGERRQREHEEREHKRQLELRKLADEQTAALTAAVNAERKVVTRLVRKMSDPKPESTVPATKADAPAKEAHLDSTSPVPEKWAPASTRNTRPDAPVVAAKCRKHIPASRCKTAELVHESEERDENQNVVVKKVRKRKHQVRRKNKFVRRLFDIDDLLGFGTFKDFHQLDDFFLCDTNDPWLPVVMKKEETKKRRRVESQKIWISQLKDIDRLYKSSELRDIKLDGLS